MKNLLILLRSLSTSPQLNDVTLPEDFASMADMKAHDKSTSTVSIYNQGFDVLP
jgi:hypothetical protein